MRAAAILVACLVSPVDSFSLRMKGPMRSSPVAPRHITMNGGELERSQSNPPSESAFVAKVFGTVGLQLGVTAAMTTSIVTTPALHDLAPATVWPAFGVGLALIFASPLAKSNLVQATLLAAFTFTNSWIMGAFCSRYVDAGLANILLQATGIVSFDVFVLSIYALRSEGNFAYLEAGLFTALTSILIGSVAEIVCASVPALQGLVPAQDLALAVCGAAVFSLYIVYDVAQLKEGGRYFEQNLYVGAALNLYLDILNLFLDTVRILARFRSNKD